MKTLTVELALVPADAGAKPEIPIINLTIKKSLGAINKVGGFSLKTTGLWYNFTIKSDIYPGIKALWDFNPQIASSIFCVSCSIVSEVFLFTQLLCDYAPASIEEDRPPDSGPKIFEAQKVSIKNVNIEIDEAKILNIIERILPYKIRSSNKKSTFEANIIESIKNYQSALNATNGLQRFTFLFHAFEKAVNADKDREGKNFDNYASGITCFNELEIEGLRTFNDRIKHRFRNDKDIRTLENNIKNFSELALRLKKATDNAILHRI